MCMFVNLDKIGTKMKLIPTIPELQVLDIPEHKINLDYINMPQKSSFVKAIEDKFDAIYVGEFPAMAQPGWYTSVPCRVFFSKNPDYAKGHQDYFGIISDNEGIRIFSMQWIKDKEIIGVVADDGEVVISRCRHDFSTSRDGSVHIDGGFDYCHTNRVDRLIRLKFDKFNLCPV